MNSNAERMIKALTPEIEKKCEELQNTRKERLKLRVFVFVCVMVALVPAMLVEEAKNDAALKTAADKCGGCADLRRQWQCDLFRKEFKFCRRGR